MRKVGQSVGLPVRDFFYTPDQVATLLSLEEKYLRQSLLHYDSLSVGPCPKDKIKAINVAPDGETPRWRIPERALVRWMRLKGIRYHERGYVA